MGTFLNLIIYIYFVILLCFFRFYGFKIIFLVVFNRLVKEREKERSVCVCEYKCVCVLMFFFD